jgi:hypothetical protein
MIDQLVYHFYYIFAKPDYMEGGENIYDPKYITKLLGKKVLNGRAFFYFKNRSDYISLFANGQMNVRGEEGMFRPWGGSEFKDLKPQTLFEELEEEIAKIKVPLSADGMGYYFDTYSEFINWLTEKGV